ncbi:flavin reductase (plasmid) [Arthrobacter sp. TES]|nr:flavin reductase [Arthrobacter sp. TES]
METMTHQLTISRPVGGIVEPDSFVAAMGAVAGSVTVVATDGPGGRFGQTVSSFCSVSADPPQVLGCLNKRSPLCAALEINQNFSINVLSETQSHIADIFAGRPRAGKPYDFGSINWTDGPNGCPLIDGATSTFSCTLDNRIAGGSHYIYVGGVVAASRTNNPPLVYRSREYGRHIPFM